LSAPAVIVQARMTSRRLPGKVLNPLAGRPMLAYTLDRLALCGSAGDLVIATSDDLSDDPLAKFAESSGVRCFRGSLDDVAGRLVAAARSVDAASFVRISGDSPFIDPAIVDRAMALFRGGDCDLVTNVFPRTFPKGMSVEVVRTEALEQACRRDLDSGQREHVTKYFYDHPEEFAIATIAQDPPLDNYAFTVDDPADFRRAEALIGAMDGHHASYGLERLVALYDRVTDLQGAPE
jgi:spore coat polysaccharide biosynthesis protein SpsF